jgi:hypothetical protein
MQQNQYSWVKDVLTFIENIFKTYGFVTGLIIIIILRVKKSSFARVSLRQSL